MKAIVTATLYIPRMDRLFKIGTEADVDPNMMREYKGFFKPVIEKTRPAPVNKMITAEKETVKAKSMKKGKK
jgi:hypothetical protein